MNQQWLNAEILGAQQGSAGRVRDVIFYSVANVERYDWFRGETWWLSFDLTSAKLDRLNAGAAILDSHYAGSIKSQLGVSEKAWIVDGKAKATVRFSEREDVTPIWNDIEAGIIKSVSMRASIGELEDVTPPKAQEKEYLARNWVPEEISVVPIPADAGAQFLSGQDIDPEKLRDLIEILSARLPAKFEADDRAKLMAIERARLRLGA